MTQDDLLTYLASEDNVHGLDPVAGHGFLCASIVGKPLNNWLSLYFDGQENTVPNEVKAALSDWRETLLQTLKNEESIQLPFYDDNGDEVDLSDEGDIVAWNIGFVDAMYADEANNWFDNENTEEDVADLTLPMIVLSGIADDDDELMAMREDDELMVEFVNTIEDNLTDLFLLFHTDD